MATNQIDYNKKTPCKPKSCPSCGDMECFERPRYFCGQLLTDRDLDAGQRYVIEKNRLHNRYLVGSGVVCGLAVRCDPCDGIVNVEPGYAIDCCGNDIVVCEPRPFDVNKYLEACFKKEETVCEDKIRVRPSRCDEKPQEYFLVISYSEEPAKPITAINRDSGCNTTRCEPSRTRETFRLDLITAEELHAGAKQDNFWSKAKACLYGIFPLAGNKTRTKIKYPDGSLRTLIFWDEIVQGFGNYDTLLAVFCKMKQLILNMYKDGPKVRCGIEDELEQIEQDFPASPNTPHYGVKIFSVFIRMYGLLMQLFKDCLCEALLVPCSPCNDEQVLLSSVTVRKGKVTKICNIVRKQVLTGPALRYWLQPIVEGIGNAIDKVCCTVDIAELFEKRFDLQIKDDTILITNEKKMYMTAKNVNTGTAAAEEQNNVTALAAFKRFGAMVNMTSIYALENLNKVGTTPLVQPQNLVDRVMEQLQTVNMNSFFDQESVMPADIHNQPVQEVMERLKKAGMTVEVKDETPEIAASKTFESMTQQIPANSRITIYKNSDNNVTWFRIE